MTHRVNSASMMKLGISAVIAFFWGVGAMAAVASLPALDSPWYREIQDIRGINLPHLDDDAHESPGGTLSRRFIDDSSFQKNLNAMGWNFFRLPVVWSRFVTSDGKLDLTRIDDAVGPVFGDLVDKLRTMHLAHPESGRIVLAIDFHQFKFGPDCGGEGVPSGMIDMLDTGPSDGNCLFKGFQRFWENENGVQEKWVSFVLEVLRRSLQYSDENSAWLTIAVEPMNEPFPGSAQGPFSKEPVMSALNYLKLYRSQNAQSANYLVPFYKKVLSGMETEFSISQARNHLFIFDPYIIDFLNIRMPFFFGDVVMKGSRYRTANTLLHFPKSGEAATWMAAPHFYGAGSDPCLKHTLPDFINQLTSHYPNFIYNRKQVIDRVRYITGVFKKIGMETYMGEVGTFEDLLGKDGSKDGYIQYIKDMKDGVAQYCRGFAWWRYFSDDTAAQNSYYLLYGAQSKEHAPLSIYDQRLKCDSDNDLVRIVFDSCPAD